MSLTGVYASLAPLMKTLQVRTFPSGAWAGSEWVPGTPVTAPMTLAPLPLAPRDLKNLDSGEFSLEDKKFYQYASETALKVNDQIEDKGVWYTIRKPPLDRTDDGGYRLYFGKRQLAGPA